MAASGRFDDLIAACKPLAPAATVVVHPCDVTSVRSVAAAAAAGLIDPILVGPPMRISAAAAEAQVDLSAFRIEPTPHSHASAAAGAALVRRREGVMLMKGSLHTDELMQAVVAADTGLRTDRRISHVYVMDMASYPRLLLITDGAINIAPSLEDKRDIVQNAIELAQALGIALPKVAVLSAVETVTSKLRSTLDAAALCKMADRGQITGGLVEGPLAFDNAVDPQAAAIKGLSSPVAGCADILLVPDLEAGNMLAKQLTFLAGADAAGLVVGASVPIMLSSRADSERAHVGSCAVGRLMVHHRLNHPPAKALR